MPNRSRVPGGKGSAGGKATAAKYGSDHMREIGRRGFEAVIEKHWHGDRARYMRRQMERSLTVNDPAPWNGAHQFTPKEGDAW